jgi:hypothetical protein
MVLRGAVDDSARQHLVQVRVTWHRQPYRSSGTSPCRSHKSALSGHVCVFVDKSLANAV